MDDELQHTSNLSINSEMAALSPVRYLGAMAAAAFLYQSIDIDCRYLIVQSDHSRMQMVNGGSYSRTMISKATVSISTGRHFEPFHVSTVDITNTKSLRQQARD